MSESEIGFVFLPSYYEAIQDLTDECRLKVYDAIIRYGIKGVEPDDLTGASKAIFLLIRPSIDASTKRYRASIENGKKGGRPPKNQTKTQA